MNEIALMPHAEQPTPPRVRRDARPRVVTVCRLLARAAIHALAVASLTWVWSTLTDARLGPAGTHTTTRVVASASALTLGALVSALLTQWTRFAAAVTTGSELRVRAGVGLRVIDIEHRRNSLDQFNAVAITANLGSWAAVLLLAAIVPVHAAGRAILVGAVGAALYRACREWPVIVRAQGSRDPAGELARQGPAAALGSLAVGLCGGALLWLAVISP